MKRGGTTRVQTRLEVTVLTIVVIFLVCLYSALNTGPVDIQEGEDTRAKLRRRAPVRRRNATVRRPVDEDDTLRATAVATRAFAERSLNASYRITSDNLTLSQIGVGTYLGDTTDATDALVKRAVVDSVIGGMNVIDTASNYRKGRAEECVGEAIGELVSNGFIETRAELLICTKAGFMSTPEVIKRARAYGSSPIKDFKDGRHCVTAACLRASIDISLDRLRIDCIDVLYLHNLAEKRDTAEELEEALLEAFRHLESERKDGRVAFYGLATFSKGFRVAPGAPGFLSLRRVIDIAKQAAGCSSLKCDHGFRYVQLPVNPLFPEFHEARWQEGKTLAESARDLGVTVVASKSLGVRRKKQKKQEDDCPVKTTVGADLAQRTLQVTRSTPGLTTALVGHKTPSHVTSNLAVLHRPPLHLAEFNAAVQTCPKVKQQPPAKLPV